MQDIIVTALLAGKPTTFGPGGRKSAIRKQPVTGPVAVGLRGLAGDAQADKKHHGGPDQAVHHYAYDHYERWLREYPEAVSELSAPGFFGENISTLGITEKDVCVGDRYRLGTAVLEVSQGREPCWKLARRIGRPEFARRVQELGATGWFYRILEAGSARGGDRLELLERPHPEWSVARLLEGYYLRPLDRDFLQGMAALPALSVGWRKKAQKRLDTGTVEPWSRRLTIP
ncbi:MAG: MOSC domain-containing protein, partial [Spirochaetota bacterium]